MWREICDEGIEIEMIDKIYTSWSRIEILEKYNEIIDYINNRYNKNYEKIAI